MSSFRFSSSVVIALLIAVPKGRASAPMTFDSMRAILATQQGQPAILQYNYEMDGNSGQRECRYARRSPSYYHASIEHVAGDHLAMPVETAWDGQAARTRARMGIMAFSRTKASAVPACPTPEDTLWHMLVAAYALPSSDASSTIRYTFSKFANGQAPDETVATFLAIGEDLKDGRLEIEHNMRMGGLPSRIRLYSGATVVTEYGGIEYLDVPESGNVYHFPVKITLFGSSRASQGNLVAVQKYVVNVASLVTGEQVRKDFVLTPWPNEVVLNMDTRAHVPVQDAQWQPDERMGFPFSEFWKRTEWSRAKPSAPVGRSVPADTVSLSTSVLNPWAGVVAVGTAGALVGVFLKHRSLRRL